MKEGLASILVPAYNGEKYLIEFLNSIKEQTYKFIQLIIRDDCSTDSSYKLCKDWIDRNEQHFIESKIIKGEKNVGLSKNISILASYAEGEFIFISDQDDVWKSNKIEYQVEYMRQHPKCMISLSDRSITDEKLNIMETSNYRYAGYKTEIMDFKEVIKHRGAFAANTMCIRNGDYDIFNIPEAMVCHDTFIAVMASYYGTVNFIFEPLLLYRIHKHNLSGNYGAQFSRNIISCFCRYYKTAKRIVESHERDGSIIEKELKRRYNIELNDYQNCFSGYYEKSVLKCAWQRTLRDYKAGKIGIWCDREK